MRLGCLAWLVVALAACDADDEGSVSLPVLYGVPVEARAKPADAVELTRDGRILFRGEERSFDGLVRSVADAGVAAPLAVRADRDACWMHVQWVLTALAEAGHARALLAYEIAEERAPGYAALPIHRGGWADNFRWDAHADVQPAFFAIEAWAGPKGAVLYRPSPVDTPTTDPDAVVRSTKDFLERVDASDHPFAFVLAPRGTASYTLVVTALVALRQTGVPVDFGFEGLHPWDRDRRTLPSPPHDAPVASCVYPDFVGSDAYPVNAPVAPMGEDDKDNDYDDRVIVTLTSEGRLLYGSDDVTLAGLAERLEADAKRYDEEQKRKGKTGWEPSPGSAEPWSKLFVLVRADQDAPLGQVCWILGELSASHVYRVQFQTRRERRRDLTPREAERRWAGRDLERTHGLDGKLACFLPTCPCDETVAHVDVRVEAGRWSFRDAVVADPSELVGALRDEGRSRPAGTKVHGRIEADARTPFAQVVAALDAFSEARMDIVDLPGVARAPEHVRTAQRLPVP
jgi:biopolymer transport protein ExbD